MRIDITNILVDELNQTERDYGKGYIESHEGKSYWVVDQEKRV